MPSALSWLDNSERDRRRALDVISLFKPKETRDELGIGTVRDALAELLAPGTTTLQTRARYFLFVPWMYRRLESRRISPSAVGDRVRRFELRLSAKLAEEDPEGAIGRRAGEKLKRTPSSIYWAGLSHLRIYLGGVSQARYHASMGRPRPLGLGLDALLPDDKLDDASAWDPHVPEAPDDFPDAATFRLRRDEAEYLQDRIRQRAPDSLLSYLVDVAAAWGGAALPWDDPVVGQAPEPLRTHLEHARCFSELMHGAALLYNLMLAKQRQHAEWIDAYATAWSSWAESTALRLHALHSWDRPAFWRLVRSVNARVPMPTQSFAERWFEMVLSTSPLQDLADSNGARQLILERELRLKGSRARLRNRQYLELWSGASGADQLSYRWGIAQAHARDIRDGLAENAEDAATS